MSATICGTRMSSKGSTPPDMSITTCAHSPDAASSRIRRSASNDSTPGIPRISSGSRPDTTAPAPGTPVPVSSPAVSAERTEPHICETIANVSSSSMFTCCDAGTGSPGEANTPKIAETSRKRPSDTRSVFPRRPDPLWCCGRPTAPAAATVDVPAPPGPRTRWMGARSISLRLSSSVLSGLRR